MITNLFRKKRNVTKGIFTTNSSKRCLALRKKVEIIEEKLNMYYSDRKRKMEDKAISQIKNNPRAFYAYARRFQKTFSGVGPLINKGGEIINEAFKIAEAQR